MKKIFIITIISLAIFAARASQAAVLYSSAANQDVYEGQSFVLDWFLDTEGKPVNTLDLKLDFSKDTLAVTDATAGNSLISLWLKSPRADNATGKIELIGGIPNGGISSKLPIFRMTIRPKNAGAAFINLDPSSTILINDGLGTNETLKFKNEVFNVYPQGFIPVHITSPSHPDQNAWYQTRDVVIKFASKSGEDYSYSFSSNIEIIPDDQKHEGGGEIKYANQPDGVYYFKLNTRTGPSNWKEAGVYRVQIDNTPPESFTPTIGSDSSIFEGGKFLSFSTVDKTSGISHYKVKVGLFGKTVETQSPYKLSKPLIGDSVLVTAYDEAGNAREAKIQFNGFITNEVFEWLLIILSVAGMLTYIKRK